MGDPHEWAKLTSAKTSAIQNSIIPSVTFFFWQPEGSGWSLVCQKRVKWELMGSSWANTGGHYEWEAITQIKYTARGKWSWNLEGKYKLKRLVNIIMCTSGNQMQIPKRSVEWWKRRHEETELHGNCSKVTTLPQQSFTVAVFLLFLFADMMKSLSSTNVTDWSSRWTVKIKRMTKKHAAYTARGANPTPPPHPPPPTGSL